MSEKQSSVNIDSGLARLAVEKSKVKNLHRTLRGLIVFLLNQFNENELNVNSNPQTFDWNADKRTSIVYDDEIMAKVKAKIKDLGLVPNNDFIINFLLLNFLNND